MKELFPFAIIDWIPIQDRAGTLLNPEYNKHINLDLLHLSGCFYFCQILYISVEGFCFTCINDSLSLNNVYGNIFDMEVKELLENKKAVELRKLIFGGSRAPKEFICQKCVFMKESIQKYQEMWRDV